MHSGDIMQCYVLNVAEVMEGVEALAVLGQGLSYWPVTFTNHVTGVVAVDVPLYCAEDGVGLSTRGKTWKRQTTFQLIVVSYITPLGLTHSPSICTECSVLEFAAD